MKIVDVDAFLQDYDDPIFDVRSPGEFASGHIPGSISFPLFSDEERAIVGTIYKQKGHDEAVVRGLQMVGGKLSSFADLLKSHLERLEKASCRILCYRGGMRSSSLQWLFEFLRTPTVRLSSGYKGYRNHVLSCFKRPYNIVIIGGYTGCGKTKALSHLKEKGHQVLDLEALAHHKGSAFGLMPGQKQPTIEQFENDLASVLLRFDPQKVILVEDESRSIGSCVIPHDFYIQMAASRMIVLEKPLQARCEELCATYGVLPKSFLQESVKKIEKRLGSLKSKEICDMIENGKIMEAAHFLMSYYDASYDHSRKMKNRTAIMATHDTIEDTVLKRFSS